MRIIKYDVFTQTVDKGNPVGIITDADSLSPEVMQNIAHDVGYNECCFICSSDTADYRLRYFTPGHETPLCGHATIGTMKYLADVLGLTADRDFKIETGAGVLDIHYDHAHGEIRMDQANAEFIPFTGDPIALMNVIGLEYSALDDRYPIVYGSTGSWTTIVPIKSLTCFSQMQPNNKLFPAILTDKPRASIHPFTFECFDPFCTMHGRHFSSCYSGTIEDSVTGTASGVMAAYYLKYVRNCDNVNALIEQGHEIGKEGLVHAFAQRVDAEIAVRISGTAVKSCEFNI